MEEFTVEKRKVQQVGYSTLNVSLPSNWVKTVGLKRGDFLLLTEESDGSLKLMPSALAETRLTIGRELTINSDLCNESGMLERVIIGNYILGRESFLISSSSKRILSEHVEEVRCIAKKLIGLGIVEESPNRIVLQCSIDASKLQIDTLMRQLSVIVSTMYGETLQALADFNESLAKDAIRREDEVNMMYWLIMRLLLSAQVSRDTAVKIGVKDPLEIPDQRMVSKYLETIADCAENVAQRVLALQEYRPQINPDMTKRLYRLGSLARSIFEKAMDCISTGDIKVANHLLEMRRALDLEEEKLMRQLPDIPHLGAVVLGITRIAESGAGIAVIALDRALERPNSFCVSSKQ